MSQDLRDRVAGDDGSPQEGVPGRSPRLPPIAYPILGTLFGGALVWAFSRVLLAVSAEAARAIALFMAVNILIGAALVAYGRRVRRRPASFPLLLLAFALMIAAGIVSLNLTASPEAGGGEGGAEGQSVQLAAIDIQFSTAQISVTAGSPVVLDFDNQDAGTPHNVAVFQGDDPTGAVVFRGELVTGVTATTYSLPALEAGSYYFHCDVHPQMAGTITVSG